MLAHVSGWGLGELMDLPISELRAWCEESVVLWNHLNPKPE